MTNFRFALKPMWAASAGMLLVSLCAHSQAAPSAPGQKHDRARVVLATSLPALDGSHLRATLVEVYYGPGEASPRHSHPCAVTGYVVQGSIRTQVEGRPLATYKAGESFYEAPGGVHLISANASAIEAAMFVAYFVCDHETQLSTDAPEQTSSSQNPNPRILKK